MKSMKNLKRGIVGSLKKRPSASSDPAAMAAASQNSNDLQETARQNVKAFCEAGTNVKGDEVLFLPSLVDAAESSPLAAAEALHQIRKFLSKAYYSRPSWQYNAIMLVRILTDNPGETFTRNMDDKFVDECRQLLKSAKESKVRQMLMETLDEFEHTKGYDEGLKPLTLMWQEEKHKALAKYGGQMPRPMSHRIPQQPTGRGSSYFSRHHKSNKLPAPDELASRLEEARTSAKLLEQVVMNTPPAEIINNDLIKEFADRCLSASRSVQVYMVADDPVPDNDTMESLIDTNEQLQTALSQHQRALLSARKQLGLGDRTDSTGNVGTNGDDRTQEWVSSLAAGPAHDASTPSGAREHTGKGKGRLAEEYQPPAGAPPGQTYAGASGSGSGSGSDKGKGKGNPVGDEIAEDPFADPREGAEPAGGSTRLQVQGRQPGGYENGDSVGLAQLHSEEPFHPGFSSSSAQAENRGNAALGAGRGDDDDEDLYESTPSNKQPMHRY